MLRKRLLRGALLVGVTAGLAILLFAGLAWAAPAAGLSSRASPSGAAAPVAAANASILARRLISVPFGISATQQLATNGKQVQLTGHAECWDESRMFDVRIRLAQSTTETFGEAHTIAICDQSVDQQLWTAVAPAENGQGGSAKFSAGPALACAQATEFGQHGVVDEHAWCKDVTLTTNGGY